MKLGFHMFRTVTPCITSQCLHNALSNPPISAIPVNDIIGIPYAYDIVFNEGTYLIAFFIFVRMVTQWQLNRINK